MPIPTNFAGIPQELKQRRAWGVATLQPVWNDKTQQYVPDKAPRHPRTGYNISPTDSSAWATYEECERAVAEGRFAALGYFLSAEDDYTIIDLDKFWFEPTDAKSKVAALFAGYVEYSQSGAGLHCVFHGKVGGSYKREGVEVYDRQRFMILTGQHAGGIGVITEMPGMVSQLVSEMYEQGLRQAGDWDFQSWSYKGGSVDDLINDLMSQRNGDKFRDLFTRTPGANEDWSERDAQLVGIIAHKTRNHDEILAVWERSALWRGPGSVGASVKPKRANAAQYDYYCRVTIDKQLRTRAVEDRQRTVGIEQAKANVAALLGREGEKASNAVAGDGETKFPPFPPNSLIARLCGYLYKAAPKQIPEFALGAAIATVAGIVGRSYHVRGIGLNLYVALIAKSGIGKSATVSLIDDLIMQASGKVEGENPLAAVATHFIGPGEFRSGAAVHSTLADHPVMLSMFGEFGLMLQEMTDPRSATHKAETRRKLVDVYMRSGPGKWLHSQRTKKSEESLNAIASPGLTFLGDTTPETFYPAIRGETIAEGFVSRLLTFEYTGGAKYTNYDRPAVSEDLVRDLRALIQRVVQMGATAAIPTFTAVGFDGPDVEAAMLQYEREAVDQQNAAYGRKDNAEATLWSRAAEKVQKLAALNAVARDWEYPSISFGDIQWASEVVQQDIVRFRSHVEAGDVGNPQDAELSVIERVASEYFKANPESLLASFQVNPKWQASGLIPERYFVKRLRQHAAFKANGRTPGEQIAGALRRAISAGVLDRPNPEAVKNLGGRGASYYTLGAD